MRGQVGCAHPRHTSIWLHDRAHRGQWAHTGLCCASSFGHTHTQTTSTQVDFWLCEQCASSVAVSVRVGYCAYPRDTSAQHLGRAYHRQRAHLARAMAARLATLVLRTSRVSWSFCYVSNNPWCVGVCMRVGYGTYPRGNSSQHVDRA